MQDDNRYFILNVIVSEIFFCLSDWSGPASAFIEKFLTFIVDTLSEKVCGTLHSSKTFFQKHSLSLIPFIPKLILQVDDTWRSNILQGFTEVFRKCDPDSSMKLVCLSAIEEMLFPKDSCLFSSTSDSETVDFQMTWIREIPLLLTLLGDKNPSSSKAVLRLQLRLGQCAITNSLVSQELDNIQCSLREFYSTCRDGDVCYGPFMKLARDIQELSICCLYYFSFLDPSLLQSIAACCLCPDFEPFILFRFLEVVSYAYTAGHIQVADYISFLITLLSRYQVFPESSSVNGEKCWKSNFGLFTSVTSSVCSYLTRIGDVHLVFKLIEEAVIDQISNKLPLENTCALFRMMITLDDSKRTKLSEQSIFKLVNALPGYLIDVVSSFRDDDCGSSNSVHISKIRYYILPCFILFSRSEKFLSDFLNAMRSFISGNDLSTFDVRNGDFITSDQSTRIIAVVRLLLLIFEDARLNKMLLCHKKEIDGILHNILNLLSNGDLNIEKKHKIQCAYDQLKTLVDG
ncbi:uncharacterized protein [Rutidosis leptorrhynchoides]|uniref:uncharacterized protein n=1 Tax=Rutidosis leptorrhynchoides TaxID=125765 RepID=UPI003A9A3A6F